MNKTELQRKRKARIKANAGYLTNRLADKGFVVQRYDAFSSFSIYLKLDYGVANTIRISDHPGKEHLGYRYNLLLSCDTYTERWHKGKHIRYFFPLKDVDMLIHTISLNRLTKLMTYGEDKYRMMMRADKNKGYAKNTGFWKKSKIVAKGTKSI